MNEVLLCLLFLLWRRHVIAFWALLFHVRSEFYSNAAINHIWIALSTVTAAVSGSLRCHFYSQALLIPCHGYTCEPCLLKHEASCELQLRKLVKYRGLFEYSIWYTTGSSVTHLTVWGSNPYPSIVLRQVQTSCIEKRDIFAISSSFNELKSGSSKAFSPLSFFHSNVR